MRLKDHNNRGNIEEDKDQDDQDQDQDQYQDEKKRTRIVDSSFERSLGSE